jgi:shikimate kinase
LLAPRLKLPFVDTDRLVEERLGASIATIFTDRGEDEFRAFESRMLAEACRGRHIVATGGGIILRPENRALMRDQNLVVWLDVPVPVLARRLAAHERGEERPLLTGDNLAARLADLNRERRELYKLTAHVRCAVATGGQSGSHRIAVELTNIYRAWENAEGHGDG